MPILGSMSHPRYNFTGIQGVSYALTSGLTEGVGVGGSGGVGGVGVGAGSGGTFLMFFRSS